MTTDFVQQSVNLALQAHHGQKYGNQTYYEGHILPVVLQAEVICQGLRISEMETDVVRAIANLHDVLEDTSTTLEDIREIYRIPDAVPNAVEALTKPEDLAYGLYLSRVGNHTLYTVIVKLADSLVNYRASVSVGRMDNCLKYANNINFLTTVLGRQIEKRNSR